MRTGRRTALLLLAISAVASLPTIGGQAGLHVDAIEFVEESDQDRVLEQLDQGYFDLYGAPFDAKYCDQLTAGGLQIATSYGRSYGLVLNPAVDYRGNPRFPHTGQFNGTAIREVREGILSLIDRAFIVSDILYDHGLQRWTVLNPAFASYAEALGAACTIEAAYPYDMDKAFDLIANGLTENGAVRVGETWYDGETGQPIGLTVLVAARSNEQQSIAGFIASQFEDIGLSADVRAISPADIHGANPSDIPWNIWLIETTTDRVVRDQAADYQAWFALDGQDAWLYDLAQSTDLLPAEAFDTFGALAGRQYSSDEERLALLESAEQYATDLAWRQWLCTREAIWAWNANLHVIVDTAAGIADSYLWAHTLCRIDENGEPESGGDIRVALPGLLAGPWNPISGSAAPSDRMIQRATEDWFVYPDPTTGTFFPHLVTSAEVLVASGTCPPDNASTDEWIDVDVVSGISVPREALVDWYPDAQQFVRCDEKYPEGLRAASQTTIVFADSLLATQWHDGSTFSVADLVMRLIVSFDRARPDSPYYDELASDLASDPSFKGIVLDNTDPVTVIVYHDTVYADAGTQVFEMGKLVWPYYGTGMAPWHTVAVGLRTEEYGESFFSPVRAAECGGVSVQDWLGTDESRDRLYSVALDQSCTLDFPYAQCDVLVDYLEIDEVYKRCWQLNSFFDTYGHMWIGNGPMLIERVDGEHNTVFGRRFEAYPHDLTTFPQPEHADPVHLSLKPDPVNVTRGESSVLIGTLSHGDGTQYDAESVVKTTYAVFSKETEAVAFVGTGFIAGDRVVVSLAESDTDQLDSGLWTLKALCILRTAGTTVSAEVDLYVE